MVPRLSCVNNSVSAVVAKPTAARTGAPLRVVVAHNYYQQPGGEDAVFRAETALLEAHGHEVHRYTVHNDDVVKMGKLELARAALWNAKSHQNLSGLFRTWQPDIVHVHNTLPLISPAIYYAARTHGAAVVQTLHNYRLFCPPSTFFRDGAVCEDCLGGAPWPAVRHACYRDSRAASAVAAAMLSYHRWRGTYEREIDAYIALTGFAKDKFIEGGVPATKLHVKPNFIDPDPGFGAGPTPGEPYALFVGRLVPEKGVMTLLNAWKQVSCSLPLKIVGEGTLASEVKRAAAELPGAEYLGPREHAEVLKLMRGSSLLVFPSTWYEGLPMTVLEAFATGAPVVASNLGGLSTLLEHGQTGLHFEPGNPGDLARVVNAALTDPQLLPKLRRAARELFERRYTAEANYRQLRHIYECAQRTKEVFS